MEKKERMLKYILNNVNWLMNTTSSVEVIPYYDLSWDTFDRVRRYFAEDADYSEVVCLISTSIMEVGKSGILFTTYNVYTKAWGGILATAKKNSLYGSSVAEFDFFNSTEFDIDRMKELMSDLADITFEEDLKGETDQPNQEKIKKAGKTIGSILLGGMSLLEIGTYISDALVAYNNDRIAGEVSGIKNSSDIQGTSAMEIYDAFFPLVDSFKEASVNCMEDLENERLLDEYMRCIYNLLKELRNQVNKYLDISPQDSNYGIFLEWLMFWISMFGDGDEFRKKYTDEELETMPEVWAAILLAVDMIMDDNEEDDNEGDGNAFSSIIYNLRNTIYEEITSLSDLINEDTEIEEFSEDVETITETINESVHLFSDTLDIALDYLE
jgi:hypothetical protein